MKYIVLVSIMFFGVGLYSQLDYSAKYNNRGITSNGLSQLKDGAIKLMKRNDVDSVSIAVKLKGENSDNTDGNEVNISCEKADDGQSQKVECFIIGGLSPVVPFTD